MSSTRRELLRHAALFGGSLFFARGLTGCAVDPGAEAPQGGDTDGADTQESADELVRCAPPVISANHGHALLVPAADVNGGVAKTYSIRGSASHDHKVTITAGQFAQLGAGRAITVISTSGAGHTHTVKVTCTVAASPPPAACANGATATRISANHGHSLTVSKADVASGRSKTYSIKGSASHPHDVTISAAQFAVLAGGSSITLTSTNDAGHAHTVTVACG